MRAQATMCQMGCIFAPPGKYDGLTFVALAAITVGSVIVDVFTFDHERTKKRVYFE